MGLCAGLTIKLYQKIMKENPDIHLIASGGVSGYKDIENLTQNTSAKSVVVGKAIYENKIKLSNSN